MKNIKDVQPIREKQQIEDMKWALKKFCSERDYIMFLINTGLRVSDLLQLKVADVKGKAGCGKRGKNEKTKNHLSFEYFK